MVNVWLVLINNMSMNANVPKLLDLIRNSHLHFKQSRLLSLNPQQMMMKFILPIRGPTKDCEYIAHFKLYFITFWLARTCTGIKFRFLFQKGWEILSQGWTQFSRIAIIITVLKTHQESKVKFIHDGWKFIHVKFIHAILTISYGPYDMVQTYQ